MGQQITPSDPEIEVFKPTLVNAILSDNTPQSDTNIDFGQVSSATNGRGLYYTNTNTEDNRTTYYYRGAVTNNYVQFAGFYWRIVRINEDGSVRLIYQGETPNATENAATIGSSAFNSNYNDNAYVGYMYGEVGSNSYSATHANANDSTIKTVIDTWYEDNLLDNYASYLADSGFCGDRSIASETGVIGMAGERANMDPSYGAFHRLYSNTTPQFSCPQENDLYTTASSKKGNKALDYSIGLITLDEVAYSGWSYGKGMTDCYLNIGYDYWTISPKGFSTISNAEAHVWNFSDTNFYDCVENNNGLRPVINLKSSIEIVEGGNGTSSNPYVIKTS